MPYPENDDPVMTSPNTVGGVAVVSVAHSTVPSSIPPAPPLAMALRDKGDSVTFAAADEALDAGEPFELVFAGPLLVVITGGSLPCTQSEVCSTPENSRAPSLQGGGAPTRPSPKAGGAYVSPHLSKVQAAIASATAEPAEAKISPQAGGAKAASPQAGGAKAASPHAAVAKPSPLAAGAKPSLLTTEVKKTV